MSRSIQVAVAALLACSVTHAEVSAWPAFTGINAVADSAQTAQSNPAGMSRLEHAEFVGELLLLRTDYEDVTTVSNLALTREDADNNLFAIPQLFYVRPLSERMHLGVSLSIPAGFGDDYGSDSPSRYLVEEWSLAYVSLAPALSYQLNDQWSVGAAVPLSYAAYEIKNAVLNPPGDPDGKMKLDADGFAVSFQGGILFEPTEHTRFGLTYRSAVKMDLEGSPDFSELSAATQSRLQSSGALDADVKIGSNLPPAISAGAFHEFPGGVAVAIDVARLQWSEFKLSEFAFLDGGRVERESDYDDIWAGSAAVSIPLSDRWALGLGGAYMDSPVDTEHRSIGFRVSSTWAASAALEFDRGNDRSIAFNLSYLDLGDGTVESQPLPVLGVIEAEYADNWALLLDIRFKWGLAR